MAGLLWLAAGECRVTGPYGDKVADRVPPLAVRLRRDFGAWRSTLIRAHALMHQATRGATRGADRRLPA